VRRRRWLYWRHWPTLTAVRCWVPRQTRPTPSYLTSTPNFSRLHRKSSPVCSYHTRYLSCFVHLTFFSEVTNEFCNGPLCDVISSHLTSSHFWRHLIWPYFIWTECAVIGCSQDELGHFTVPDPIYRGCDQAQHTRFRWNEVDWDEGAIIATWVIVLACDLVSVNFYKFRHIVKLLSNRGLCTAVLNMNDGMPVVVIWTRVQRFSAVNVLLGLHSLW